MKLNEENRSERLYKIFIYVVLGLLAVLILIPVLWVIVASVKETSEHYGSPWALPTHIHWQNFVDAWTKANMGGYMLHSVMITVMALVSCWLWHCLLPTAWQDSSLSARSS